MFRTFIRQDAQIGSTNDTIAGFVDNTAPASTMESAASTLTDDLNNIRSMLSYFNDLQTGNWYDAFTAPAVFPSEGAARGFQTVADDLHELERKRVLVKAVSLADVAVPASQNWVVLGSGEFPPNTTAAVGAVTTLGTVVATHGGTFDTHDLTEVSGSTAISPKNFVEVVDGATRDPILSSGRTIYGLLHGESGLADGDTIIATTPDRVQVSFVRINATGDDLEACPVADIESTTVNLCFVERKALDDLTEQDFLRGAVVDVPAAATVTRQVSYDNQGTTPVDLTTNATLDLESAGISWSIRDDLEAALLTITEGSAGGTSEVAISSAVDLYDNDAVDVDFASGASINSGGTRPIDVGVNDGVVESTAGDLEVRATTELYLDDGNQAGSTWAQTAGIKLSDTTAEWDAFEVNFGEVSLLNALNQSYDNVKRTKVQATLTADVAADTDVNGPGTAHNNTDVDLAPYDSVPNSFVDDVEVYLNGELLGNAANDAGGGSVYPGGTPADGDLAFQFALKGTGSKPDQITVIVNGQ